MKRSRMPDRTTPLHRSPWVRSQTPVERDVDIPSPSRSAGPKSKRPAVTRGERRAKRLTRARSGGLCEMRVQGVCLGRYREFSHRWAEGHGGPWLPSNGLASCGLAGCHGWLHSHPDAAKALGWIIPPTYRIEDGRRVEVPPAEFPAVIWLPGWDSRRLVFLDDEGGWDMAGAA